MVNIQEQNANTKCLDPVFFLWFLSDHLLGCLRLSPACGKDVVT